MNRRKPKVIRITDEETLARVARVKREDGHSTLAGAARWLINQALKDRPQELINTPDPNVPAHS